MPVTPESLLGTFDPSPATHYRMEYCDEYWFEWSAPRRRLSVILDGEALTVVLVREGPKSYVWEDCTPEFCQGMVSKWEREANWPGMVRVAEEGAPGSPAGPPG